MKILRYMNKSHGLFPQIMSQVLEFFSPEFDFRIDIGFLTVTGACRKIALALSKAQN